MPTVFRGQSSSPTRSEPGWAGLVSRPVMAGPRRVGSAPCSPPPALLRSEEHTSELQSLRHLVCRLLLEKKKELLAALTVTRNGGDSPLLNQMLARLTLTSGTGPGTAITAQITTRTAAMRNNHRVTQKMN